MRFLIVEDEISIAKALKAALERDKHTVDITHNGNEAYDLITGIGYDALVFDIMIPGIDGLTLLKKIRSEGINTPVMFLTAKGEIEDRVEGLNAGADDYLPKPFSMREFLARANALTRRKENYTAPSVFFGNVYLNRDTYSISTKNKEERLNNKEYQMMELFMRNPRHVFSSEVLMDRIWEINSDADIDVVWTYIGYLRKKLKNIDAEVSIKTVRGLGYSLEDVQGA